MKLPDPFKLAAIGMLAFLVLVVAMSISVASTPADPAPSVPVHYAPGPNSGSEVCNALAVEYGDTLMQGVRSGVQFIYTADGSSIGERVPRIDIAFDHGVLNGMLGRLERMIMAAIDRGCVEMVPAE